MWNCGYKNIDVEGLKPRYFMTKLVHVENRIECFMKYYWIMKPNERKKAQNYP